MSYFNKQKALVLYAFIILSLLLSPALILAVPQNPDQTPTEAPAIPREDPVGDPESADPPSPDLSLDEKRQLALQVLADIDKLAMDTEILIEDFNKTQESLNQTEVDLARAERNYESANKRYQFRQGILKDRIQAMYRDGGINFFEVVLSIKSFSDFITRVRFLSLIAQKDSDLAEKLLKERATLRSIRDKLEQLRQDRVTALQELQAKRAEIESKLREREQHLWKVEKDIQDIVNAELLKKAEAQTQLYNTLKAQASQANSELSAMTDPTSPIYTAMKFLGIPYLWGGEKPETGFDCSGLSLYVFRQHGVVLPHYSRWQFKMGEPVDRDKLKAGDLLFFGNPIHHLGIYIGGNYMIHAPQTGDVVKISDFSVRKDWAGARRFPLQPRE